MKTKEKLCLSIETSGTHLGLSLTLFSPESGAFRHQKTFFKEKPQQQSDILFPELKKMMKKAKARPSDIDLIAVDKGPGSFTGVRIGVAATRALAQGLGCPLVGVNSLEIMAHMAGRKKGKKFRHMMACLPALAGEAYFSYHQFSPAGEMSSLVPPRWKSFAEFVSAVKARAKNSKSPLALVGDRAHNLMNAAGKIKNITWVSVSCSPHPEAMAELAIRKFVAEKKKKTKTFSYKNTVPLYLQPSWAERKS